MTSLIDVILPGDVMVVYDTTIPAELIRIGEMLQHQPDKWDHVLMFSHRDANGTPWAMEAHPGGIGWTAAADLQRYLNSHHTINNIGQPKTADQRVALVNQGKQLFGTPYDWVGIGADFLNTFGPAIWQPRSGVVPAHLVCSSYLAYLYHMVRLGAPDYIDGKTLRTVMPSAWGTFILDHPGFNVRP